MLENPYELGRLVAESGAHGTDLVEPETPEDLRRKTVAGAAAWAPVAEKIWNDENDPMYTKRLEGMQQGMADTDLECARNRPGGAGDPGGPPPQDRCRRGGVGARGREDLE